jgi:lysophospholipase L1-like esterase
LKRFKDKKFRIPEDRIYLVMLAAFGCLFALGKVGQTAYARLQQNTATVSWDGAQESETVDLEEGEVLESAEESGGEQGVVYQTVEDDYFADAVFIGDSRTVGLYEYGGLQETSTFYASTGLSVYKLFSARIVEVPGQKKKQTVEEALSQHQFARIYLMLGINEMGTGTVESFLKKYAECVEHLRELQPDAIIYLQSIMKVTAERSEQGDYVTNEGIDARNEGIAALADNEHLFYLDVNPVVCDETGGMVAEYTHDGVHLKAQYVKLWTDFLKCHAIAADS